MPAPTRGHRAEQFLPKDKVQNLLRSCLVLTVIRTEGEQVICESYHEDGVETWRAHWSELTIYEPMEIETIEPLVIDVRELSAVDLLEYSRDGHITNAEYDAARAEDDRQRAARKREAA